MEVYCVYLGDVYLKSFRNETEAFILASGLKIFLTINDMDMDIVRITKEVI